MENQEHARPFGRLVATETPVEDMKNTFMSLPTGKINDLPDPGDLEMM